MQFNHKMDDCNSNSTVMTEAVMTETVMTETVMTDSDWNSCRDCVNTGVGLPLVVHFK